MVKEPSRWVGFFSGRVSQAVFIAMVKKTTIAFFAVLVLGAWCSPSHAQIAFTLTISPSSITFLDANPTTSPSISASSAVQMTIVVTGGKNTSWSVHSLANGDLQNSDGVSTIPISNLSWTSSQTSSSCKYGCQCLSGTMNRSAPQNMIIGTGNTPGNFSCNMTFNLLNNWGYNTGSYTQSVTITATAP